MEKELELVKEIVDLTKKQLIVDYRFIGNVLASLPSDYTSEYIGICDDNLYINPKQIVKEFSAGDKYVYRIFLHMLLHYIFCHDMYASKTVNRELWNLSADIIVERVILEFGDDTKALKEDSIKRDIIKKLESNVSTFSQKVLMDYIENHTEYLEYADLFHMDVHDGWKYEALQEKRDKRKVQSKKTKTELETFSKANASKSMMLSLKEATRDKVDYKSFLRSFAAPSLSVRINDDEIDMITYTYGLEIYEDVLLVEPTEVAEDNKIKDFAIVIDTSGSTVGNTVMGFIKQTYSVLKEEGIYDELLNIHIIECDNQVRKDVIINTKADVEKYVKKLTVEGFGGTDFTPAFDYVDGLIENGKLKDFRGLIYFTDLRGTFPKTAPKYKTAFVYADEYGDDVTIPSWAIKVRFEEEG